MADEKKTETKKLREKSFPPPFEKDHALLSNVRHWKAQKQTFCSEEKCYYPLKKHVHDGNSHIPEIVQNAKGVHIKGVCSWDPLHGTGDLVPSAMTADGVVRIQLIKVPDPKTDEEA